MMVMGAVVMVVVTVVETETGKVGCIKAVVMVAVVVVVGGEYHRSLGSARLQRPN